MLGSFLSRRAERNNYVHVLIMWAQKNTCQEKVRRNEGESQRYEGHCGLPPGHCPVAASPESCRHLPHRGSAASTTGWRGPGAPEEELSPQGACACMCVCVRVCACVGARTIRVDAILTQGISATHHFSHHQQVLGSSGSSDSHFSKKLWSKTRVITVMMLAEAI